MDPNVNFRRLIVLLTFLFISFLPLTAQDEEDLIPGMAVVIPVNGYVILSDGDTVFGKVRWALKYVEHYVSLPSYKKGKPVFYNRLIGGRVAVYQNRSGIILSSPSVYSDGSITGYSFTFSREDGLMIGPDRIAPYTYINRGIRLSSYYVSKDGSPLIKVDRDNYDTMFKTLFGDCPAIDEEVKSNPGLLEFKNFLIIAEVYNQICE